jgi:hypothetical protein
MFYILKTVRLYSLSLYSVNPHIVHSQVSPSVFLQMALIIRPEKVCLYNISTSSDEPEILPIDAINKHWLCTPNREALISLSHVAAAPRTPGDGQWAMDVFALEECGADQPLFHKLMEQHPVFDLPSQVSMTLHCADFSWV